MYTASYSLGLLSEHRTKHALLWDLAKERIANHSLSGMLVEALGIKSFSQFTEGLVNGKAVLIIDALDEADMICHGMVLPFGRFLLVFSLQSVRDFTLDKIDRFALLEEADFKLGDGQLMRSTATIPFHCPKS